MLDQEELRDTIGDELRGRLRRFADDNVRNEMMRLLEATLREWAHDEVRCGRTARLVVRCDRCRVPNRIPRSRSPRPRKSERTCHYLLFLRIESRESGASFSAPNSVRSVHSTVSAARPRTAPVRLEAVKAVKRLAADQHGDHVQQVLLVLRVQTSEDWLERFSK
jgi:hypothetical protein